MFPVHPRTPQRLDDLGPAPGLGERLRLLTALPYLEFLALQRRAATVITDCGGIQEETTFLGVPCLTVRENTERPITISHGTNQLVGRDLQRLRAAVLEVLKSEAVKRNSTLEGTTETSNHRVPLWDGHAAERIAEVILRGAA